MSTIACTAIVSVPGDGNKQHRASPLYTQGADMCAEDGGSAGFWGNMTEI